MNIQIRKAVVEDAKDVVFVNTYTWLTAYKGLLPDYVLEKRLSTMDERIPRTEYQIRDRNDLYVALVDGRIVGMISCGKSRNDDYLNCGEIYAIYVLEEYQGLGLGKKLFMTAIKDLIDSGYDSMILNVLKGNKTIIFYEKYLGVNVGSRKDEIYGYEITEYIMLFDDIKKIYEEYGYQKQL